MLDNKSFTCSFAKVKFYYNCQSLFTSNPMSAVDMWQMCSSAPLYWKAVINQTLDIYDMPVTDLGHNKLQLSYGVSYSFQLLVQFAASSISYYRMFSV